MTPEEKAKELVGKFKKWQTPRLSSAVPSAIIAVEEILKIDALIDEDVYVDTPSYKPFWNEVLKHLKNKEQ